MHVIGIFVSCLLSIVFSSSPNNHNQKKNGTPHNIPATPPPPLPDALVQEAQEILSSTRDVDRAFSLLARAYALDPTTPGLQRGFESCLRARINTGGDDVVQDRFGLASLLIDEERHEEASVQLRAVLCSTRDDALRDKAACLLYRTQASACQWTNSDMEEEALVRSVRRSLALSSDPTTMALPPLHPFEALKWPCISLREATQIAKCYAHRAVENVHVKHTRPLIPRSMIPKERLTKPTVAVAVTSSSSSSSPSPPIKVGYISPDFTSTHPLAFLMQDVFALHNRDRCKIHLYSLSRPAAINNNNDNNNNNNEEVLKNPEMTKIKAGADVWHCSQNPADMEAALARDDLDVLIDLCGYAGTTAVADLMAKRPARLQISYMGFPGSTGADYVDYAVVDGTVLPDTPRLTQHYTEHRLVLPHCYFVNSHKTSVHVHDHNNDIDHNEIRTQYGLPHSAFVFCCHSRPDKIDPVIFRTWMRALLTTTVRGGDAVLWLLRSGRDMERNLRALCRTEFGEEAEARLRFCDVAPRREHLRRLGAADLFLDTPAYNAHTLGCDALYANVPMVSLLSSLSSHHDTRHPPHDSSNNGAPLNVRTDKWASRVGASLLKAVGLEQDMVVSDLEEYERLMVRCAEERHGWYEHKVRRTLRNNRDGCPLFDTKRWVQNLETGLIEAVRLNRQGQCGDIIVQDDDDEWKNE